MKENKKRMLTEDPKSGMGAGFQASVRVANRRMKVRDGAEIRFVNGRELFESEKQGIEESGKRSSGEREREAIASGNVGSLRSPSTGCYDVCQ